MLWVSYKNTTISYCYAKNKSGGKRLFFFIQAVCLIRELFKLRGHKANLACFSKKQTGFMHSLFSYSEGRQKECARGMACSGVRFVVINKKTMLRALQAL